MHERDYFNVFKQIVDLRDKAVLEIGGSIPYELIAPTRVSKWVSTDINFKRLDKRNASERPVWHKVIINDASKMGFKDSSFDIVYSINSFEHILDLESCINDIYRVLRPGGLLFSKFTPIWSSRRGHHTWICHNEKLVHFNDDIIPDWYHLCHKEEELIEILKRKYDTGLSKKIIKYIFYSNDLNRLTDKDFERILFLKPFKKIFFYRIKSHHKPDMKLIQKINLHYPNIKDYRTEGYFLLLSKGKPSIQYLFRAKIGLFYGFLKYRIIK